MISFRSLTGLILMMEIIVKISAIQQLTFPRFRDLLTVPSACTNGAWFDLGSKLQARRCNLQISDCVFTISQPVTDSN
jgi:hypothetical protein